MRRAPVRRSAPTLYWDVPTVERLHELAGASLPLGVRATAPVRSLHRDVYLDTPDASLRSRGAVCRLQATADDQHTLSLDIHDPDGTCTRVEARTRSADPDDALLEHNVVTSRLRGLADPQALVAGVTLEVERLTRLVSRDWLRRPRAELHYDIITVRRDASVRHFQQLTLLHRRRSDVDIARLGDAIARELALRPAEPAVQRAELLLKWMPVSRGGVERRARALDESSSEIGLGDAEFLNPELSFLESQSRVLALAESEAVPLAERLRFLGIVSANIDEFFMVRVAGLKLAAPDLAEESAAGWGDVASQLQAIAAAARALHARQQRAARVLLAAVEASGVHVRSWEQLESREQAHLRERYLEEIHPELTPLAMTMSSGHPFPRLPHLSLSIAVVLRETPGGAAHFAQVEIPEDVPRLMAARAGEPHLDADGGHRVVPVEEVIRANLAALYPGLHVEHAYFFRVTRGSLLTVDESASSLLDAMDDATRDRAADGVVRVEVDAGMPTLLRELVLDALCREPGTARLALGWDDVYELHGLMDVRTLAVLDLPNPASLHYPPLVPRAPVPDDVPLLDAIAQRDLLVHHPFESFADTVVRFIREAANDADVTVIRMTLYRVGEHSPIVEALRLAARSGKQVYAFVELRARFDEATNVKWVRALEKAGVHVVYGLRGLKTHAKAALVVRREGARLQRYVHVGTGNYNARSGLAYTDLSLFSADEALTSDLTDLFNSLTGSSTPLERVSRGMLVAPGQMLAALLGRIEREAAFAREGQGGAIRIKVNGLSDPEVVRALTRAAEDGVEVDLIVRGICTLRPPRREVAAQRLRVIATTGRFLEHSRIYHFANAGDPAYYIGSADLRPRNLRRRVELLAPVRDAAARAMLDRLLAMYLADATGWELRWDGQYEHRENRGAGTQELLFGGASVPEANAKWQHGLSVSAR